MNHEIKKSADTQTPSAPTLRVMGQLSGWITRIEDGDTLILLDAENRAYTLRLIGIDAPELSQKFGETAKSALARRAFDRAASAQCAPFPAVPPLLCTVHVDGNDLGLQQILDGMAWRYPGHTQSADARARYEHAEFMAKIRKLGLWNAVNPTPPWKERRNRIDR